MLQNTFLWRNDDVSFLYMILYFLKKHFDDKDRLIIPINPLKIETEKSKLVNIFDKKNIQRRLLNIK